MICIRNLPLFPNDNEAKPYDKLKKILIIFCSAVIKMLQLVKSGAKSRRTGDSESEFASFTLSPQGEINREQFK